MGVLSWRRMDGLAVRCQRNEIGVYEFVMLVLEKGKAS